MRGKRMGQETEIFGGRDLKNMILPLFLEQLLVMLVGMADTLVVSYAGEAAVSGGSLVNQFNTIFIYLFTALASGGAVVISQYIGRRAMEDAGESASQLLLFSTGFSVVISAFVLLGGEWLLRLLFGKVEPDVMAACVTYLRISAYSYPGLAVYNSGAAIYRSLGKTDDHVPVDSIQCDQYCRQPHRRVCPARRGGRGRVAVVNRQSFFRCGHYGVLFQKEK